MKTTLLTRVLMCCVFAGAVVCAEARGQSNVRPLRIEQANFDRFCHELGLAQEARVSAGLLYSHYLGDFDRLREELNAATRDSRDRVTRSQRGVEPLPTQQLVQLSARVTLESFAASDEADELMDRLIAAVLALVELHDSGAPNVERAVRGLRRRAVFQPPAANVALTRDLQPEVDVVALLEEAAAPGNEIEGLYGDPGSSAAVGNEYIASTIDSLIDDYEEWWIENRFASIREQRAIRYATVVALHRQDYDKCRRLYTQRAGLWRTRFNRSESLIQQISGLLRECDRDAAAEALLLRWTQANFPILMQDETPEIMVRWMMDPDDDPFGLTAAQRLSVESILQEYVQKRDPLRERAMRFMIRYHHYLGGSLPQFWPDREVEAAFYEEMDSIRVDRLALVEAACTRLRALLRRGQTEVFDSKLERVRRRPQRGNERPI